MAELDNLISRVSGLEAAIENALNTEVAEEVRRVIVETAKEKVYDVYEPIFLHRRDGDGGILDTRSIEVEAHGTELTAWDISDWQQLWGGIRPDRRLADAIASGDPRFNMQRAGARPWHDAARERLLQGRDLEDALRRGLERQGYNTGDMTIEFS